MNAPNFNFDSEGRPDRLPSITAAGSRAVTRETGDYGSMSENFGSEENGSADYRRLFYMGVGLALKYRWLIVGASFVALTIGFVFTFVQTPIYRATAVIQIDPQAAKVVKVNAASQDEVFGDRNRFYQTQYDLLRSRSLIDRVVADLGLPSAASFLRPVSSSPWAKLQQLIFSSASRQGEIQGTLAQRKQAAAGMVVGGLTVEPVANSSLVKISYDNPSPDWAKRIADGVALSFISSNLERRYGATAYARDFLKERLEELKIKLEESEKALVEYAQQKEIIFTAGATPGSAQSLSESDLTSLNSAIQKAVTDRIRAQEQWEQAREVKGLALPQLLSDPSIQALRARRATLMADYQEKLSIFKPAYPDMVKLKVQIDQIDSQINAAAEMIKQSLKARYESTRQEEEMLKQKINEAKTGVLDARNKQIQYNILRREADTNRTLYDGLLQQYKDVGIAGAVGTNNVAIIDHAQMPGAPYKPDLKKNLLIALMLGLLAAVIGIAVFEILDDTFKSPEEIEDQLGLAVLGIIPLTEGEILSDITASPNSPLAEAYRSLRTALQFSTDQGAPRSILVTSARPSEGKSTTALALAVNFAQLGMKVLLIDADLRNPSQHRILKRDNTTGLANYLAGATAAGSLFQETDVNGLFFMATGPLPPNPAELLAGPKMMSLLSAAGEKFEAVVIDAPPVMGLADAPLLASITGGTLFVMATGDTRRGIIKAALKRLHFARARTVGAVMNKFDFQTASYGYGYGYGSGYGYGALEHYGYGQSARPSVEQSSPE